MGERDELARAINRSLSDGGSVEAALRYLRANGCSMADAAVILADVQGTELDKAQEQVVNSGTWADFREAYDSTESALWDHLSERGVAQADGSVRLDLSDL